MKNILLYMTDFYGYNNSIIAELEKQGWNVYWFLDKVTLSPVENIVDKIVPQYKHQKFDKYFLESVNAVKDIKFDLILIVYGAAFVKKKHLEILRQHFKGVKIVYYAWDSVANFPGIKVLFENADVSFTFDRSDAQLYHVSFLPLFYAERHNKLTKPVYDISTVMTFFSEKSESLKQAVAVVPKECSVFYYLKLRSFLYYLKLVITDRESVRFFGKYFQFKSLNSETVYDVFDKSKAVLDCPLPKQKGLTMRTFEVLSKNKKMITTNTDIVNYDFYSPDNIFVVQHNRTDLKEFLDSDFNSEFEISEKYSLESFICRLTLN